jgi:hypothetical protein
MPLCRYLAKLDIPDHPTKELHALAPAVKGGDVHSSATAFDLVVAIASCVARPEAG